MADTTSAEVFDPEVHADIAQAKFLGAVKIAGSAAVIEDNTLEGEPGSTIDFPKWNALGELDDLTEGTPMVPVAMGHTSSSATIKEAGKAVEITSKAGLVALGDPKSEAVRQFGILAARKVDSDLIDQAQADETADGGGTPFEVATAAGATAAYSILLDGVEPFGDEFDPAEFAGVYMHSTHRKALLQDDQFLSAQELARIGATVARGQIGELAGVPVVFSDRLAQDKMLIVKRNVLGLLYKQRPIVERDRDILKRSDVITTNLHYACKRLDDRGVSVVTFTPSA